MKTNTINIQHIIHLLRVAKHTAIQRRDTKEEIYRWVEYTLVGVRYLTLKRKEKGIVRKYLRTYSGYSDSHTKYLIGKYCKEGYIRLKNRTQRTFPTKYGTREVALLAETSAALGHPNGRVVQETCKEMYFVYGDERYRHLKDLSVPHLYRLRKKEVYKTHARHFTKTKKTSVPIGERRKPRPDGKPGYIRVDSVHQGDRDGEKGVYHINLVDEVTQWQVVVCVEGISEQFLIPAIKEALHSFPFTILNFHSDNGSEYINHTVANLLEKMRVTQTKGRTRHCNDNALVESKNASTIRKHIGHGHIPKQYATVINTFYQRHFNNFLNYHRFCAFPEESVLPNGKIKKVYNEYKTPVQKLLSLPNPKQHLKETATIAALKKKTQKKSHLQAGQEMQSAKIKLFT